MSNLSDGTHAYRGYRLQALYTLFRVFETGSAANLIFQPEGEEDLSICDTANNLSEQVARLEDEARTGTLRSNELALLRLVSVASAFDARYT
jgi:hypothetical protein